MRLDHHNNIGTFFTPRLHIRFVPIDDIVLRLSGGVGRKAANIFAENQTLFSTARKINIQSNEGSIYGLNPEKAWNYGLGLSKSFFLGNNQQFVTFLDYYRGQKIFICYIIILQKDLLLLNQADFSTN